MTLAANLPLVERELLRAGRNVNTYLSRTYLAIAALAVMVIVWWADNAYELGIQHQRPETIGKYLAWVALGFQFIVIGGVAPSLAAPLVIHEKEERALPLLLVTGRRYSDILGAKAVSSLIQAAMMILCIVPLQAIAALFGGIDIAGIVIQGLLMTIAAAAVCALGIYFSTICSTVTAAISLVQFALIVWFVSTLIADRYLPSIGVPVHTNIFTLIPEMAFHPAAIPHHLPAILVPCLIALLTFVCSLFALPKQVLRQPVAKRASLAGPLLRNSKISMHRLVLAGGEGLGLKDHSIAVRIAAFLGLCVVGQIPVLGWLVVLLVFLRTTARGLGRLRVNGALDDLLLTPQDDRDLIAAMFKAGLASAAIFCVPLLIGIVGIPFTTGANVGVGRHMATPSDIAWCIAAMASQLALVSAIGCYTTTVPGTLRTIERAANLLYLGGALIPVLLPYLGLAIIATSTRYDVEPLREFMFGRFVLVWIMIVPVTLTVFLLKSAVRRLRVKANSGPPVGKPNTLLAILRP